MRATTAAKIARTHAKRNVGINASTMATIPMAASITANLQLRFSRAATIGRRISNGAAAIVCRATRGRSIAKSTGGVNACVSRRVVITTSVTTAAKFCSLPLRLA